MKEFITVYLNVSEKIGDFAIWVTVRVVVYTPLISIKLLKRLFMSVGSIFHYSGKTLHRLEQWYGESLKVYDALPYGGIYTQGDFRNDIASELVSSESGTIRPLLEAINDPTEEKEVMIIGSKGTGKSTVAQYLAYKMSGRIKVYEPEGTPTDWRGIEVVGEGEDWKAINEGMREDLEHISSQMKLRKEKGDNALIGSERVIIGEEYPEVKDNCDNSFEWLKRHARRGRKARVRLILLSQYDRAKAWGLDGHLDLLECFYRLRLGIHAQNHAKSLKNNKLVDWLKQSKDHALLNDEPVLLPSLQERLRVINESQLRSNMSQNTVHYNKYYNATEIQDSTDRDLDKDYTSNHNPDRPLEEDTVQQNYEPSLGVVNDVLKAIKHGDSDNKILTEIIMPRERVGKPRAKILLEDIKKLLCDNTVTNGHR